VTLYAIGGWLVYLAAWWTVLPRWYLWTPHSRDEKTLQNIIKAVPALVGPVLILFIRRIVQSWYTRKAELEEKQLKSLMAEQRTKIDEIKKKTNYYTTKNLLDRYDEPGAAAGRKPAAPSTPDNQLRKRNVPGAAGTPQGTPGSVHSPHATPNRPPALQVVPPGSQTRQHLLQQAAPQPMAPLRKQWYDKLADAILGDDEASGGSQHSRYALVCDNCFAHNGLVRESEYDEMRYVCPKCGFFNPSPRMKRENQTPMSSAVPRNWSSRSPAFGGLAIPENGSVSPPPPSTREPSPLRRTLEVKDSSASLRNDAAAQDSAPTVDDAESDASTTKMDVDT